MQFAIKAARTPKNGMNRLLKSESLSMIITNNKIQIKGSKVFKINSEFALNVSAQLGGGLISVEVLGFDEINSFNPIYLFIALLYCDITGKQLVNQCLLQPCNQSINQTTRQEIRI